MLSYPHNKDVLNFPHLLRKNCSAKSYFTDLLLVYYNFWTLGELKRLRNPYKTW